MRSRISISFLLRVGLNSVRFAQVILFLPVVKQAGNNVVSAANLRWPAAAADQFFDDLFLKFNAEISLLSHSEILFPSIIND